MTLPFMAGHPVAPSEWQCIRKCAIFDCCKWDIQSEDHPVLADFALLLDRNEWTKIAGLAEQLASETLAAESELISRCDLHKRLALPRAIRHALARCAEVGSPSGVARVMRFDFHYTSAGWCISEVNSDVPGGFIEASGFAELMAPYYPGSIAPPNPARVYAAAIISAASASGLIAFVHATAHYDDRQVMDYLAKQIAGSGLQCQMVSPAHLRWESGLARIACSFASGTPSVLVRFFPAEWFADLRPVAAWEPWFAGGHTPMSNPATALLTQSKRFPLAWLDLRTPLRTWRSLLSETRSPEEIPAKQADLWVFKPVFGRVGEDVAIAGVTSPKNYAELLTQARRHPHRWVAQRRFEDIPLQVREGTRNISIGVFTVDGRAAGAYGRIATKPLIDNEAQDVAVLLR